MQPSLGIKSKVLVSAGFIRRRPKATRIRFSGDLEDVLQADWLNLDSEAVVGVGVIYKVKALVLS